MQKFWTLMFETRAKINVAIVTEDEWGTPDCFKYIEEKTVIEIGDMKLTYECHSRNVGGSVATGEMLLLKDNGERHKVRSRCFKKWPREKIPDDLDAFVEFAYNLHEDGYTALVHSSVDCNRGAILEYVMLGVQNVIYETRLPNVEDLKTIRNQYEEAFKTEEEFIFANVAIYAIIDKMLKKDGIQLTILTKVREAYTNYRTPNGNGAANNGAGVAEAPVRPAGAGGNLVNGGAPLAGAAVRPAADGNNLANAANSAPGDLETARDMEDGIARGGGTLAIHQPAVNGNVGNEEAMVGEAVERNSATVEDGIGVAAAADVDRLEAAGNGLRKRFCTIL